LNSRTIKEDQEPVVNTKK